MSIDINKIFTIVIPSKEHDKNLINCLAYIRKYYKKIEIFLLLDKKSVFKKDKYTKIFYFRNKNIGFKRNYASKKSTKKYLIFIDSDAYPKKGWLENYLEIIKNNKNLTAIGGPNLSPKSNLLEKIIVSNVRKLPFVTLNSFIKSKTKNRYTDFLPSCNLCINRKDYINLGGMDERVVAGEEIKLFYNLKLKKKKVFFSNKSIVYHIDRNLKNFMSQRMTYGTEANLIFKYPCKQTFFFAISTLPFLNFLFTIFLLPIYQSEIFKINLYFFIITMTISLIFAIIISKFNFFIKYFIAILMSIYGPGIGFIIQFFLDKNEQKKRYKQI